MTYRRSLSLTLLAACFSCAAFAQTKQDNRELIAAVEKKNGYTRTEKSDTGAAVLTIQFRFPGPGDDDLLQLRPLLESAATPADLNLNQCSNVTDMGLVHLEKLETLHSLGLGQTKVTDAGLKSIEGLKNLDSLYLADDKLTDAALVPVGKLAKLRKLSVYSKGITDAGFKNIEGLTNLEEIHVGDYSQETGDTRLEHVKGMTKLKTLSIGREKLTDAGMAHVRNFTEIKELRLEGPKVTAEGLKNLAPLKKLVKLTVLSCPAINSEVMSALSEMADLQELELIYCGAIKPEAAAHLKTLTGLRKLRFEAVENEALKGIAGLTKLEDLQLFYTSVGDAGLQHLSGLTGLKSLNLMKTRVTDAGLKSLAGLSNLRDLNLGDTATTGEGVEHLAGLKKLKTLSLFDCKIADAGLKHLSGLTGLEQLSLGGNPITDAGLGQLKSLNGLKDLNLTGTRVNDEAVLELKKALPKTRIRDVAGDEVTLEKRTRPKPKVEDISKVEPAFKLTAEEFAKEYKDDKAAAEKKYKNQVIELNGTVGGMGRNFSDDSYLSLQAGKNGFDMVMCFTVDETPWIKAIPGQKVKLKGKWPEFSVSAALVACVIVEAGPSPAVTLTADELAKEFKTSPEKTTEKYKDKWLIVTGEIVDREFNSAGAASVQLKAAGDVKVKCSFTAFDKSQTKQLKIGQKVTLVGQYTLNFGGQEVGLYFCQVIKKE